MSIAINKELTLNEKTVWLLKAMQKHLATHWLTWLLLVTTFQLIQANYQVIGNKSESINGRFFLLHKGQEVHRGDIAIYQWDGWGPYPYPALMGKYVVGVPGDLVTRIDHEFFINGKSVGIAKDVGLTGTKLTMNPIPIEGYVIKPGEYFFNTPHPYSLDSRYKVPGFVPSEKILGRAEILF
jgi:conjugal transfer pilin signal peptidase TrbI